jgi:hypothetical protein
MMTRTLLASTALALLLVPIANAHTVNGDTAAETTPPLGTCTGAIDFACFHWDCNRIFCIRLFCPVYIGHSGGASFGCTPH